jgi:ABC-2 type transport system ATP-binding protein
MCDRVAIIQAGKLIDVRSIRQGAPLASEASRVLFEVDRTQEAVEYLAKYDAAQEDGAAMVNVDRDTIAVINAELVTAGFKVFSIRVLNKSLEEQFLEMTGGESVV